MLSVRVFNAQYIRERRKFEPQWKSIFPVLLHDSSQEFSHLVCKTFLNEGDQVGVCTSLLPISVFPYSCLREVTLHTHHTLVYLNLYPHIIHAVKSSAVNVVSLGDFPT